MAKSIFITGTGTDIGKTYIAGLIVKKIADAGKSAAYYKAAMSGNDRREDGTLIPGDALFVRQTAGIEQPLDEMCPYVYENAYSPHLASRIEGHPVELSVVKRDIKRSVKNTTMSRWRAAAEYSVLYALTRQKYSLRMS